MAREASSNVSVVGVVEVGWPVSHAVGVSLRNLVGCSGSVVRGGDVGGGVLGVDGWELQPAIMNNNPIRKPYLIISMPFWGLRF